MKLNKRAAIRTLRRIFSDEAYANNLAILANRSRKSRKRKEACRALVRLNTPPSESDFVYHLGRAAYKELHKHIKLFPQS